MEKLPNMPNAMETEGGIYNGNLYLFGRARSTVFKFNIEEKKWYSFKNLKRPVSSFALVQHNQYFIVVGDYTKSNQLILYNAETGQATYFKTSLQVRRLGASITDNELFVYEGANINLNYLKQTNYKIDLDQIINNQFNWQSDNWYINYL